MAVPAAEILFGLDAPLHLPGTKKFKLVAWITSPHPIEQVRVLDALGRLSPPLTLVERPDVRAIHPGVPHVKGIEDELDAHWLTRGFIEVVCNTGPVERRFTRDLPPGVDMRAKAWKLARILKLLRTDLPHEQTPYAFDFLNASARQTYNIVDVEAVSDHGYDPIAREIIASYPDGLILDAGAGFRKDYLPNVVNFEIVAYPSTDVIGVGEELPFVDHAFDAVLTLDVLEHVKDPFKCARELTRVLKPGGRLYAVVPFLQPYHGYPHHYYNMTHQGLANLFEDALEVSDQQVPASGVPIWTLCWFLKTYADGLSSAERERFTEMKIEDFMAMDAAQTLINDPIVTKLAKTANLHLASTTLLLGTKR